MVAIDDDLEAIATLKAYEEQLISSLKKLGCDGNTTDLAADLKALIYDCIGDLLDAVADVPVSDKSNTRRRNKVSGDSQRVVDFKTEMEELWNWFRGSADKPYKRDRISSYTLKAMLGDAPFGDRIIAAVNYGDSPLPDTDPENRRKTDVTEFVHFREILSSDPHIAQIQRWRYEMLRGRSGQALYSKVVPLHTSWPRAFLDLVGEARAKHMPVFYHVLDERLTPEDRAAMARNMLIIMGMMDELFPVVSKSRLTLRRWSHGDPIFTLIRAALDTVWPSEWGKPEARTVSKTRKAEASERELLEDIAVNLVNQVQWIVDSKRTTFGAPATRSVVAPSGETMAEQARRQEGERLEQAAYPNLLRVYGDGNSVLGTKDSVGKRVIGAVAQVLTLRAELMTYVVVRRALVEVCEHVSCSRDEPLRAAANQVSGAIVPQIDKLLVASTWVMAFGYDNLEGETLKWYGRLDVKGRFRWSKADKLHALMTRAGSGGEDARLRILELCDDLVAELQSSKHLDTNAVKSWKAVWAWAMSLPRFAP